AQLLLLGCTGILGFWLRIPQWCLFGTILCGVAAVIGGFAETQGRKTLVSWTKGIVAAIALLIPIAFLFPKIQVATLDNLYAVGAWTIAAAVFVPDILSKKLRENASDNFESNPQSVLNPRWRQLALVWGAYGTIIWLAASYAKNQPIAFHAGLAISIGWLLLFKFWFRLPTILIQIANTAILLSIGLPLVDVFLRP